MSNAPARPTVGIIGLGDMGANIGRSILRAGFELHVFDTRPEPIAALVEHGALGCASTEDVASRADLIAVVVVDDEQVRSVVRGMLPHAHAGAVFLIHSTIRPSTVIELAEEARAAGLDLIDATVTGGAEKAALGQLTVLVGGADMAVQRCRPVLQAIGRDVFHLGPVGAGSAGKLVNQLLALGGYALQIEAMQLATAYGIDEESATSFLVAGGADSRGIRTWGLLDRVRRSHERLAGTEAIYRYMAKDLHEATQAAGERSLTLPLTAAAAELLPEKMQQRDRQVPPTSEIPRCRGCDQELALPYRDTGEHPECRQLVAGS